jgi:EAL domain-containing protein (putative c-di-GMP-specific phosphodiesterase class I)
MTAIPCGSHMGEGFLFSKPVPFETIEDLLREGGALPV